MALVYAAVALTVLRYDVGVLERLFERTSPRTVPEWEVAAERDFAALTDA